MILQGHVLEEIKKISDESVDCVITSPPYYRVRDYGEETIAVWGGSDGCNHTWTANGTCIHCGAWKGQLGQEPTVQMYIEHLTEVFRELRRTLKATGNCFIIIADKYKDGGNGRYLIPERLKLSLAEDGWIVQDSIIWTKKLYLATENRMVGCGLPESHKRRLSNGYEIIIHLVKGNNYFKKPKVFTQSEESLMRLYRGCGEQNRYHRLFNQSIRSRKGVLSVLKKLDFSSKFKSLWQKETGSIQARVVSKAEQRLQAVAEVIETVNKYLRKQFLDSGLTVEAVSALTGIPETTLRHYFRVDVSGAAIPTRWAWRKLKPILELEDYDNVVKPEYLSILPSYDGRTYVSNVIHFNPEPFRDTHFATMPLKLTKFLLDAGCPEAVCATCGNPIIESEEEGKIGSCCENKIVPGLALDPFLGSGTLAVACEQTRRRWLGIEINSEYCRIAEQRVEREAGSLLQARLF